MLAYAGTYSVDEILYTPGCKTNVTLDCLAETDVPEDFVEGFKNN